MGWVAFAAIAAVGTGTAIQQSQDARKARNQAADANAEQLRLRKELADQSKAPIIKKEAKIELESEESLEDQEIRLRSKKNRLRVGTTTPVSNTPSTSTGLKVG